MIPNLTIRISLHVLAVLASLSAASALVGAHGPDVPVSVRGLGLESVVGLTVALGVLGGAAVVRWRSASRSRLSTRGFPALLVVLGCWATAIAILRGTGLAAGVVVLGAATAWSLRDRVVGEHRGCDHAALGAVVLHRFVEGVILASLYSADAAVGVGATLVIAAHTAAETGAVAGLWSTGRWQWVVVGLVQMGFVAGALGGGLVARYLTPLTSITVLALLGGALVATGVATSSRYRHATHGRRDVAG